MVKCKKKKMETIMKFTEKLARMMIGRYGSDSLNRFIVIVALVLTVVNIFLNNFFLYIAAMLLLLLSSLRTLSRRIDARRKENAVYLRAVRRFTGFFKLIGNRWRDRKTHVYRKCPKCKAVLRLPKKRGKHTVACPKCKERFDVSI